MDKAEALRVAEAVVVGFAKEWGVSLVVLAHYTQERPYGWVFAYNSPSYVETGDMRDCLFGPGPLLVTKGKGCVFSFNSSLSTEGHLALFESALAEKGEENLAGNPPDRGYRGSCLGKSTDFPLNLADGSHVVDTVIPEAPRQDRTPARIRDRLVAHAKRILVLVPAALGGGLAMWAYFHYVWPRSRPPGLTGQDASIVDYAASLEASMLFCSVMSMISCLVGRYLLSREEFKSLRATVRPQGWAPLLCFCGAIILLAHILVITGSRDEWRRTGHWLAMGWGLALFLPFIVISIRAKFAPSPEAANEMISRYVNGPDRED